MFPGLILQWWTAEGLFNGEKRPGYWFYFFFSINRSFETGMEFLNYLLTNKLWKLSITPNYKIHVSISIFSSLIKKKRNNPACLFTAVSLACVGAMLFSVHIAFILPSLWRLNISLKC